MTKTTSKAAPIDHIAVRRLRDGRFEAIVDGRRVIAATAERAHAVAAAVLGRVRHTRPVPMGPWH